MSSAPAPIAAAGAVGPASNGASAGRSPPKRSAAPTLVQKLWKQTKFCLWGALGTWYLDVGARLSAVYAHAPAWSSHLVVLATALLALTVAIFAYLISLPFRGIAPSYARWSQDPILRTLVPVLTLAIVGGFVSLTLALSPLAAPPRNLSTLAEELSSAAAAAARSAAAAGAGLSSESRSVFHKLSGELSRALRQSAASAAKGTSQSSVAANLADALRDAGAAAHSQLSALDLSALSRTWRSLSSPASVEALAVRLGIPPSRAAEVQQALSSYSHTVDAWIRGSSASLVPGGVGGRGSLGWIGAILGATATYLLVFGVMGLVGLAAPSPSASTTRARSAKTRKQH